MNTTKPKAWTAAGILVGLCLISGWLDDASSMPTDYRGMYQGTSGGRGIQSPISGYGTTGTEVFNNPDATGWRDMIFIAD